jgi:hypothetical protein
MALSGADMFATTVAGSLPKPLWLAEPEKLSPAWRLEGNALAAGEIDATILAVRRQEDAGSTSSATASRPASTSFTAFSPISTASISPAGRRSASAPTATGPRSHMFRGRMEAL